MRGGAEKVISMAPGSTRIKGGLLAFTRLVGFYRVSVFSFGLDMAEGFAGRARARMLLPEITFLGGPRSSWHYYLGRPTTCGIMGQVRAVGGKERRGATGFALNLAAWLPYLFFLSLNPGAELQREQSLYLLSALDAVCRGCIYWLRARQGYPGCVQQPGPEAEQASSEAEPKALRRCP